jgi:hypothetical protein
VGGVSIRDLPATGETRIEVAPGKRESGGAVRPPAGSHLERLLEPFLHNLVALSLLEIPPVVESAVARSPPVEAPRDAPEDAAKATTQRSGRGTRPQLGK